MVPKKKIRESIRKDLEKEIMYGFKEEFLQQYLDLNAKFKVDRGKLLRAWIEGGMLDTTDIRRPLLKKALERVGVVIYQRASPREKPYVIFFVDIIAKKSAAFDANESAGIFKKLFPGVKAVFVAMDKEPEKLKKSQFKHLDDIIVGTTLEEIWEKTYKFLKETFLSE